MVGSLFSTIQRNLHLISDRMNWSALVSSHILVLEYISPGSIGGNTPIANTGLHNPKQGTQVWVVFQKYYAYLVVFQKYYAYLVVFQT